MLTFNELIKNLNILLVDDDDDFVNVASLYLQASGYNIEIVRNGTDAIKIIKEARHQIVLLDYFMPDISGENVVNEVRKFNKEVIIIMQTGFAGQKPPIDTMQRLNIQNYHDKTEGMDKLNLELVSAVKIFNQQNEIAMSKFRKNAIGKLINSIAADIKSNLMCIGAGIEVSNMLVDDIKSQVGLDNLSKLHSFYESNKSSLEKIDKVLTAIMKQTAETEDIMQEVEVIDVINLILNNELKLKGVTLNSKISLRAKTYLTGSVNDIIFIICELILKLAKRLEGENKTIDFVLTEDEENWFFEIQNDNVRSINENDIFFLKNIVISIEKCNFKMDDKSIILSMKK